VTLFSCTDKQQELDLPSLRIDKVEGTTSGVISESAAAVAAIAAKKVRDRAIAIRSVSANLQEHQSQQLSQFQQVNAAQPMSHIARVKGSLTHLQSFSNETEIPKYGVESGSEEDLALVSQ
jgi:hypothetical protein